jgi:hypothetical protein
MAQPMGKAGQVGSDSVGERNRRGVEVEHLHRH